MLTVPSCSGPADPAGRGIETLAENLPGIDALTEQCALGQVHERRRAAEVEVGAGVAAGEVPHLAIR